MLTVFFPQAQRQQPCPRSTAPMSPRASPGRNLPGRPPRRRSHETLPGSTAHQPERQRSRRATASGHWHVEETLCTISPPSQARELAWRSIPGTDRLIPPLSTEFLGFSLLQKQYHTIQRERERGEEGYPMFEHFHQKKIRGKGKSLSRADGRTTSASKSSLRGGLRIFFSTLFSSSQSFFPLFDDELHSDT